MAIMEWPPSDSDSSGGPSPCSYRMRPSETPAGLPVPVDRGCVVIANLLLFGIVANPWEERERRKAQHLFPGWGGRKGRSSSRHTSGGP